MSTAPPDGSPPVECDDLPMPAAQRSYGGRTADARRTARQASLRETALDIMAANEWRTATVDKVCAAAGLNKRYFYESFTDLDALAAAVVDAIADDVREATLAAVAGTEGQPLEYQAFVGGQCCGPHSRRRPAASAGVAGRGRRVVSVSRSSRCGDA